MRKHNLSPLHPDSALIAQLGGVSAVAREIGYDVQRVSNWRKRGIPAEEKLKFPEMFLPHLAPVSKGAQQ